MEKNDWAKIKSEYITTNTSYRKLAEKYNIATSTMQNRAKRENWVELRKRHRRKIVERAVRKVEAKEADRLARIGVLANKALDVAMGAFEDEQQFNRYIISEGIECGGSVTSERIFDKVDTKALRDLTAVIKDLASVIRNVYGIPTQAEVEAQRIAAERLEMDKRKAAEADSHKQETVEVIFEGEDLEDWCE